MLAVRRLLTLVCLVLLSGCRTGIVPRTPRVARAPGYELQLRQLRTLGLSDPGHGAHEVELAARALPAGASVVWMGVAEAADAPCSVGMGATNLRRHREPHASGETVSADLSLEAWKLATRGPSRLDVLLEEPSGVQRCAAFPLIDERPETRWLPLERWTLGMVVSGDFLTRRVDGLDSLVFFGAELGRWVGPVRLHAQAGGGASICSKSVCPPMKDKEQRETESNSYYFPLQAGAELVLAQLGPVVLDARLQYRVGVTKAETYRGKRLSLLHGPLLTPALTFAMPDPIAPGVPGGTRRGMALSLQAPMGYLMSSRGNSSPSFGFGLVIMFPLL